MMQAFSGGLNNSGSSLNDVCDSIEELFKNSKDPEIRSACALVLARGCHPQALKFLEQSYPSLASGDRLSVAECFSEGANANAAGLLRLLLQDSSQEVRSAAAEGCTDRNSSPELVVLPLEQFLLPGHTLKPEDFFHYQLFNLLEKSEASRAAAPVVRKLVADSDPKISTFGLLLLQQTWSKADEQLARSFFTSQNPWQRRAAFQAVAWSVPGAFQPELKKVVEDPSEEVRRLLPELMSKNHSQERYLALDENKSYTRNVYSYNSRETRKTTNITPENLELLQKLTLDPSNKVRVDAFFSLLEMQQKVDLSAFIAVLNSLPDRDGLSSRLYSFFTSHYSHLGQEFAVLMPFVSERHTHYGSWDEVRSHFANSAPAKGAKVDRFAFVASKRHAAPVLASYVDTGAKTAATASTPPAQARVRFVFFYTPGCPDCKRTEKMLAELKGQFARLEVELHNLREVNAMRLNEALCERFNIPAKQRSVSPAIFAAGGSLVKGELNFEALKKLLAQSAGKSEDWIKLPESALAQAGSAIQERYSTFSVGVVTAAGLLDGINPCAFATIIFLISYLQVAKRAPRQILQVGVAFVVGVFLAYFILGLGLVEIVARISLLRGAGKVINGALGVFALGIMVVSLRDGFLCLQGRLADTSLQLPGFLKTRIFEVIRTGARHSRFVLAAFVSGVVISFLELACTGQVYAPTILYMLKAGRAAAWSYLLLYNLAFVLPLVTVFLLAYAGVRSPALIQFQTRHAALVKFATAALFLLLFIILIRDLL
jgi:cytochrome c biogenesis protein CcdA/HEAT repeat protein/glutaredoxin